MRHLPAAWTGRFDYVIHTLSEFGCFAEEAENRRVLAEVARVLTPGGRYLLDIVVNRDGWLVRGVVERVAGRCRLSGPRRVLLRLGARHPAQTLPLGCRPRPPRV